MSYRYIAIEGNIGSGKTTLATRLSTHLNSKLILEEFEENDFLSKFYQDPERYAFPLELSFLSDRYKQTRQILQSGDLFETTIVSDYFFLKSKIFARINLPSSEYELFQKFYNILEPTIAQPDLLIYLHAPVNHLLRNIERRGRSFEQNISGEYLDKIQNAYSQFLKQRSIKTIIIDAAKAEFLENDVHFNQLTAFLSKTYDFEQYQLSLD